MRILMQIRRDATTVGGGDFVQLKKTASELRMLGVDVSVNSELELNLKEIDIVHLFNLSVEDTYKQCLNAKKQNKLVVISSIYWNKNEYLLNNPNRKVNLARSVGGDWFAKFLMEHRRFYSVAWHYQSRILKMVDAVIGTSREEMELIKSDFGIKIRRSRVVPVGIDVDIFQSGDRARLDLNRLGLKDYILCVGRIEDLKNQLSLIRAFGGTDRDLVLVGQVNPKFVDYHKECLKEASKYKNIHFIERMSQEELVSVYSNAAVHVSPSWFETFGLVSLEAAAVGTRVVVTKNCPFYEYFGDLVDYCDPGSIQSIRESTKKSLEREFSSRLKELIFDNFSWSKIAKQIFDVYKELM